MSFDLVGKAVKNLRLPTVDYNNSLTKIIPAQKGDVNSRYFSVTLYDDRGTVSLRNYNKVVLNATLPDGTLQFAEGALDKTNNLAICKIAGSMLTQVGKVSCDILLTGSDATGAVTALTSQTFYVIVSKSQAEDDSIEGSNDYSLLVQLLNEVSELEENVETAEEGRVTAEQERADKCEVLISNLEDALENVDNNTAKVTSHCISSPDMGFVSVVRDSGNNFSKIVSTSSNLLDKNYLISPNTAHTDNGGTCVNLGDGTLKIYGDTVNTSWSQHTLLTDTDIFVPGVTYCLTGGADYNGTKYATLRMQYTDSSGKDCYVGDTSFTWRAGFTLVRIFYQLEKITLSEGEAITAYPQIYVRRETPPVWVENELYSTTNLATKIPLCDNGYIFIHTTDNQSPNVKLHYYEATSISEIDVINTTLAEHSAQIQENTESIDNLRNGVGGDYTVLSSRIDTVENTASCNAADISTLNNYKADKMELESVQSDVSTAKTDIATAMANIATLQSLVSSGGTGGSGSSLEIKSIYVYSDYVFENNALYFMRSQSGSTDIELLNNDGTNITGSSKNYKFSLAILMLPQTTIRISKDGTPATNTQTTGLVAGYSDKSTLVTTDKIQALQFELTPPTGYVKITNVPDAGVLLWKISNAGTDTTYITGVSVNKPEITFMSEGQSEYVSVTTTYLNPYAVYKPDWLVNVPLELENYVTVSKEGEGFYVTCKKLGSQKWYYPDAKLRIEWTGADGTTTDGGFITLGFYNMSGDE